MPEQSSPRPPRRSLRQPRVSKVPREVVLGLDLVERRASYVGGALALILAAIISPHLFKNTWVTDTAKPSAQNTCATHYHLVNKVCTYTHLTHPSDWILQFLEIFILGVGLILFARLKKRAGVAVLSLLLGLALGVVGLPFLFLGGWLVIRALRLQKYGDASFVGSSKAAREAADQRRAEKRSGAPRARRDVVDVESTLLKPPAASKRYTPKQRPRRR
ncbi:MAG: hypothetical protein KGL05_09785 [Acidobacteriota bacterium]|nr:hypothetical protein [Acidobacteriota bacterium]